MRAQGLLELGQTESLGHRLPLPSCLRACGWSGKQTDGQLLPSSTALRGSRRSESSVPGSAVQGRQDFSQLHRSKPALDQRGFWKHPRATLCDGYHSSSLLRVGGPRKLMQKRRTCLVPSRGTGVLAEVSRSTGQEMDRKGPPAHSSHSAPRAQSPGWGPSRFSAFARLRSSRPWLHTGSVCIRKLCVTKQSAQ